VALSFRIFLCSNNNFTPYVADPVVADSLEQVQIFENFLPAKF
jgi:hypothetical protein